MKSQTSGLKPQIFKPTKSPFPLESAKEAIIKAKQRSHSHLSRTMDPSKLRKVRSGRKPSRGKLVYDDVLNSSIKRKTVLSESIEDKYSWVKRFMIAANR